MNYVNPMSGPLTAQDFAPHASFNQFSYVPKGPGKLSFWGDLVPAVFARETAIGSFMNSVEPPDRYPADPNFQSHAFLGIPEGTSVSDLARQMGLTERAAARLIQSRSMMEFHSVAAAISRENNAASVESHFSFWSNMAAGLATAPFDPLTYLPIGGAGIKAFRLGQKTLSSAFGHFVKNEMGHVIVRGVAVGGIAITINEGLLQASQLNRTVEDSVQNIVAGAALSGALSVVLAGIGGTWRYTKKAFLEDVRIGSVKDHILRDAPAPKTPLGGLEFVAHLKDGRVISDVDVKSLPELYAKHKIDPLNVAASGIKTGVSPAGHVPTPASPAGVVTDPALIQNLIAGRKTGIEWASTEYSADIASRHVQDTIEQSRKAPGYDRAKDKFLERPEAELRQIVEKATPKRPGQPAAARAAIVDAAVTKWVADQAKRIKKAYAIAHRDFNAKYAAMSPAQLESFLRDRVTRFGDANAWVLLRDAELTAAAQKAGTARAASVLDKIPSSELHPGMDFTIHGQGFRVTTDGRVVPDGRSLANPTGYGHKAVAAAMQVFDNLSAHPTHVIDVVRDAWDNHFSHGDFVLGEKFLRADLAASGSSPAVIDKLVSEIMPHMKVKHDTPELRFYSEIYADHGSLNYTAGREYLLQAAVDVPHHSNWNIRPSLFVGLNRLISPIIRIAAGTSLIARDVINKLVTVPSHFAYQLVGMAPPASVSVRANVLENIGRVVSIAISNDWTPVSHLIEADDFYRLVGEMGIDKGVAPAARGQLHPLVAKAADAAYLKMDQELFEVYGKHATDVFKDFKHEKGYFPTHAIREKVDTAAFIDDVAKDVMDQWAAKGVKGKTLDEARLIAMELQNRWLTTVVDPTQQGVSFDFTTKWTDKLKGHGLTDVEITALMKNADDIHGRAAKGEISRAEGSVEIREALAKLRTFGPDMDYTVTQMMSDLFTSNTGFMADELSMRGFTKSRSFELSSWVRQKYQDTHVINVIRRYTKQAAADIEIARAFGDPTMRSQFAIIRNDFLAMMEGKSPHEQAKLGKEMRLTIDRLAKLRDDLRGVLNVPSDPNHWYGRGLSLFRGLNYVAASGMFAISNLSDAFQYATLTGMKKLVWDGWVKYVTSPEMRGLSNIEARATGEGLQGLTAHMVSEIQDIVHGTNTIGPIERAVKGGAEFASKWSGMAPMADLIERVNFMAGQTWLLNLVEKKASGGKISASDAFWLARIGIGDEQARLMAAESASWIRRGGVVVANTAAWNPSTAMLFRHSMKTAGTLNKVLAATGEKPLFFSSNMGRSMAQFKSFLFATSTKVLMMRSQNIDAKMFSTSVAQIGLGVLAYALKCAATNRKMSNDPEELFRYGIENSGLAAVFSEGLSPVTAALDAMGINPLGRSVKSREVSPLESLESLLGPSAGSVAKMYRGATGLGKALLSQEAVDPSTVHDLRQLMPFNTFWGIRQVLDIYDPPTFGRKRKGPDSLLDDGSEPIAPPNTQRYN